MVRQAMTLAQISNRNERTVMAFAFGALLNQQGDDAMSASTTKLATLKEAKQATPTLRKRGSGHAKPRKPLISLDDPGRFYTGHVLAVGGFSAANLFARIADGRFPKPRKDGKKNWWPTHEVKAALGL